MIAYRGKLLAGGFLGAMFACAIFLSAPVWGQDTSKTSGEVKGDLEKAEEDLKLELEKQLSISHESEILETERGRLNKLLIETAKRIQNGEVQLSKLEGRLEELSEQEQLVKGSIKERHGTLAKLLTIMQRMGRQPPPVMATRRDDALAMVRSAMLLSSLFPQLQSQAEKLTSELTELVRITSDIKSKAASLKKENTNLENERLSVKALIAAKKTRVLANQSSLQVIQKAAEEYKKSVVNLNELIVKLDREVARNAELGRYEKELAAKKAAEERARIAQKAAGPVLEIAPSKSKIAMITPGRIKPALPFTKAKGQLTLPVQGQRLSTFGIKDKFGRKSEGITIKTRAQAQITSPNDGWVVYSGSFRSYGQLLIINAGGGYHVLLAGMGHIDVSVGQFVLTGEPIATMGAKGNSPENSNNDTSPVLYVEFRKDGRPINPDPWWTVVSEKAQG